MLKILVKDPNISRQGRHPVPKEGRGVSSYGSINTLLGIQRSRRDELESIGYILLKFLRGTDLPWNQKKIGLLDFFSCSNYILAMTYQLR